MRLQPLATCLNVLARAAVAVSFFVGLAGCSRNPLTDSAAATAASSSIQAAQQRFELESEISSREEILIAAATESRKTQLGPLAGIGSLSPDEQQLFLALLENDLETATRELEAETAKTQSFLENAFLPLWKKLAEARLKTAHDRDRFTREERKAQQTALALGTEHRWFWLSSLIAVTALLALFAVDRRHDIRRYLNGGRAKGLGLGKLLAGVFVLLCVLTLALFFASDGILVDLLDRSPSSLSAQKIFLEQSSDESEIIQLEDQVDRQSQTVESLRATLRNDFQDVLSVAEGDSFFESWWAFWEAATKQDKIRRQWVLCDTRFKEALAAIESDVSGIESARTKTKDWRAGASRVTGFIGLGLLSLVGTGIAVFARGIRKRSQKLAATCPMCLAEGELQEADDAENQAGISSSIPPGMVRCGHVISDSPFEECGFDFPNMFRGVPKLSFPTLGVPSAGKTHWLAMVYRELNRGNFPTEVEFAKIRSSGSDDFDRIVDEILLSKLGPAATQTAAIPKPVVFNFLDQDPLGQSNILVNLFDYSGEVFRRMSLEEHQRKRAFTADGYLFFLDPTQTSDSQLQPLINFRQDVRVVKKLKAGQQIHCPVALCVPKIDLMPSQAYARGGNVIDQYYDNLRDIGWGMDLTTIQQRSELMQNLRDTIWPGWEIERQIDDLFGGRYMFFPLTPVGLNEPGESDLSQRNISPVGILHPLMWLLHMSGHPVLRSHLAT